jgi:hypothetical protein
MTISLVCLGQTPQETNSGSMWPGFESTRSSPARPARVILPEEVVQDSIQLIKFSTPTNLFAVRWTYTEAGAKKALASWESDGSHYGMTPEWKRGWLKHRTDKQFFGTRAAAEEFVTKLKKQPEAKAGDEPI